MDEELSSSNSERNITKIRVKKKMQHDQINIHETKREREDKDSLKLSENSSTDEKVHRKKISNK